MSAGSHDITGFHCSLHANHLNISPIIAIDPLMIWSSYLAIHVLEYQKEIQNLTLQNPKFLCGMTHVWFYWYNYGFLKNYYKLFKIVLDFTITNTIQQMYYILKI